MAGLVVKKQKDHTWFQRSIVDFPDCEAEETETKARRALVSTHSVSFCALGACFSFSSVAVWWFEDGSLKLCVTFSIFKHQARHNL